tara:strand:- start:5063 stop:5371 length:309 start_codon:yes stop_codon:yes gene_type:complete
MLVKLIAQIAQSVSTQINRQKIPRIATLKYAKPAQWVKQALQAPPQKLTALMPVHRKPKSIATNLFTNLLSLMRKIMDVTRALRLAGIIECMEPFLDLIGRA